MNTMNKERKVIINVSKEIQSLEKFVERGFDKKSLLAEKEAEYIKLVEEFNKKYPGYGE